MGKNPAMQLYVNDWLSSPTVMTMEPLEELAYFRMCLFCWASGDCSITADLDVLARLTRTDSNTCSTVVKRAFIKHPEQPSKLTNAKVYELWCERVEFNEQRRKAGIASGKKRAKNSGKTADNGQSNKRSTSVQQAVDVSLNSSSSSSSSSSKNPPKSPKGDRRKISYSASFERFWKRFPSTHKTRKADCWKEWQLAVKDSQRHDDLSPPITVEAFEEMLISAAVEYQNSEVAQTEYVMGPLKWIRGRCWEDDREAWSSKQAADTKSGQARWDRSLSAVEQVLAMDEGNVIEGKVE